MICNWHHFKADATEIFSRINSGGKGIAKTCFLYDVCPPTTNYCDVAKLHWLQKQWDCLFSFLGRFFEFESMARGAMAQLLEQLLEKYEDLG